MADDDDEVVDNTAKANRADMNTLGGGGDDDGGVDAEAAKKRALEMALTGDAIDAHTAADWGLVNRVVPDDDLDSAVADLARRATRGSALSKSLGKRRIDDVVRYLGLAAPVAKVLFVSCHCKFLELCYFGCL